MTTKHKDYVLAFEWWEDDGWYGDNFRILLSRHSNKGFKTKKEAKFFNRALKEYINKKYSKRIKRKVLVKDFDCDERDKFETYRYCGAGPSYHCNEINITISDIEYNRIK